jgi:hypothetical protein
MHAICDLDNCVLCQRRKLNNYNRTHVPVFISYCGKMSVFLLIHFVGCVMSKFLTDIKELKSLITLKIMQSSITNVIHFCIRWNILQNSKCCYFVIGFHNMVLFGDDVGIQIAGQQDVISCSITCLTEQLTTYEDMIIIGCCSL